MAIRCNHPTLAELNGANRRLADAEAPGYIDLPTCCGPDLRRNLGGDLPSSAVVLSLGYGFKMIGAYTRRNAAQMIQMHPRFDRAKELFVHATVSKDESPGYMLTPVSPNRSELPYPTWSHVPAVFFDPTAADACPMAPNESERLTSDVSACVVGITGDGGEISTAALAKTSGIRPIHRREYMRDGYSS